MKEFKTEEEYEEASSMLVGCALLIVPYCIHEIRVMSGSVIDVVRELKRRHGR